MARCSLLFRVMSVVVAAFAFGAGIGQSAAQTPPDWKPVESALGRTGKVQPDGPLKFAMPRKDLKVTVAGTAIKPGLALGSWCAFSSSGDSAMVMGDLVLVEDEVAPVMAKLQEAGIEITALHNHVLHESPRVMYMHVAGHGDPVKLAADLKEALALTKTPSAAPATSPTTARTGAPASPSARTRTPPSTRRSREAPRHGAANDRTVADPPSQCPSPAPPICERRAARATGARTR